MTLQPHTRKMTRPESRGGPASRRLIRCAGESPDKLPDTPRREDRCRRDCTRSGRVPRGRSFRKSPSRSPRRVAAATDPDGDRHHLEGPAKAHTTQPKGSEGMRSDADKGCGTNWHGPLHLARVFDFWVQPAMSGTRLCGDMVVWYWYGKHKSYLHPRRPVAGPAQRLGVPAVDAKE